MLTKGERCSIVCMCEPEMPQVDLTKAQVNQTSVWGMKQINSSVPVQQVQDESRKLGKARLFGMNHNHWNMGTKHTWTGTPRASLSKGPSSSPSAAHTWINPLPTIPFTTFNCQCACAHEGRYLAFMTIFFFSPPRHKSWLLHLEQDPGHVLFSLTVRCKQLNERKKNLAVSH